MREEEKQNMPKLDVQTTDEIPEAEEGKSYKIIEVEEFASQVRGFRGLRVGLEDSEGNTAVEALWLRSPVGPKSKLGAFVTILGKNTSEWEGKQIRIITWKEGNRSIQLEAPSTNEPVKKKGK